MKYELTARQVPALFTLLPAALALAAAGPEQWKSVQSLLTIATAVGAQIVLAKFARYVGQRQQDRMWAKWGGNPTALLLRHTDTTFAVPTKERYRAFLAGVLGHPMPSAEEERRDPRGAMQVYESAIDYLRSATRSAKDYPLVLTENINYGLARNLYGLKPYGILICLLSLVAIAWRGLPDPACGTSEPTALMLVAGGSVGIMLAGWIFWVGEAWVQRCSTSYAKALLETTEHLRRQ
ncbi:hypothetical protein [Azospirillum soli]|uniref:hypothetical protein n=1 Tax=Azospirillum soli TaxID=1304799 RepID=UPI001AEB2F6A|nr:hypothetical protein [Azospirillum soli]MBP2311500.1 hypothetical protein [Azospirillum soli]